jgi:hypothetical protein
MTLPYAEGCTALAAGTEKGKAVAVGRNPIALKPISNFLGMQKKAGWASADWQP